MGGDDGVEVVVGHLPQHPVAQDSGVGDHDVQLTELRDGLADQALGGLCGAHGDDLGDGPATCLGDRLDGLPGDVRVDVVDDDARPGPGEGGGVGETESAAASGDDGDLSVERGRWC